MPYPNEHACRVRDPGDFSRLRRIKRGKLSIIVGRLKGKTTTTAQSYRYPIGDYTEAAARAQCKEQGGRFEAATGKKEREGDSIMDRITMNFFGRQDDAKEVAEETPAPLSASMDDGEKAWQAIENVINGKALSLGQIRGAIVGQVAPRPSVDAEEEHIWVQDVFPDGRSGYAILRKGRNYFRMAYEIQTDDSVKLGESEQVKPSFEPVKAQENAIMAGAQELGEVASGIKVLKGKGDRDYWLAFTSNAFKDLEAEAFATKTLEDYVAQVDKGIPAAVKAYLDERGFPSDDQGELWLWHIPGSRIGKPLFKAVEGRFLIEVGVFDDTPMGRAGKKELEEHGEDYRVSHQYLYRPADKATGVYGWMWKFESSALPAARAANPWTDIGIIEPGGKEMDKQKQKWLTERFGEELTKQIISRAAEKSASLEELGFDYKEAEPDPEPEGDATPEPTEALTKEAFAEAIKGLETALQTSLATLTSRIEAVENADKNVLTLDKGFRASQAQGTLVPESKDAGEGSAPDQQHIIDQKMAKWSPPGGTP